MAEIFLTRTLPASRDKLQFSWFRVVMVVLVFSFLAFVSSLLIWAHSYYLTPVSHRAFHPQHEFLKPSGTFGHLLGFTGTGMMLLTFMYSIRKRIPALQKIGNQTQWLQIHIFLGLSGPAFVTLHTAGKLGGIAAIAFYSMMAMVVSGIVGRYFYSKIPRTKKGNEMSYKQIEEQLESWVGELNKDQEREEILEAVEDYLSCVRKRTGGVFGTMLHSVADDLAAPVNFYRAWRIAKRQRNSIGRRLQIARMIFKQRTLLKRLALLEASQRLFSFWHIFHKPFTILASVVIFAHIAVAIYFGYGMGW